MFPFSNVRYFNRYHQNSRRSVQFMIDVFGRSDSQTNYRIRGTRARFAWRLSKVMCKDENTLIEQASVRVRDSRGSLISARFCQSRPYIRHYTVRSFLYSLPIIQRICFDCSFMLYLLPAGCFKICSANAKIDVRSIYYIKLIWFFLTLICN